MRVGFASRLAFPNMEKGFETPLWRTGDITGVAKGISNPFSINDLFQIQPVGGGTERSFALG